MTRTVTIRIAARPPGWLQRAWYRRLHLAQPLFTGHSGPWHADWVRLLPYRPRFVHRAYATLAGYFWLPCVLCDRPFGGHESGGDIPDPLTGPGRGITICSRCTCARAAAERGR